MKREKLKKIVVKLINWFGTFLKHILIFCLITNFVFGYSIEFFPYSRKGYYIQAVECKEGYKIYPLQYKEDEDISSWEKNLMWWGYIKENYEKD